MNDELLELFPSLARASSTRAVLQPTFTHMSERHKFVEGHAHFIKQQARAEDARARNGGYKDAHDLKKAHVKGNESKFDIQVDAQSGKGRLISKDGRTIIPIY